MHPDKVLVIDVGHLYDDTTHCNKRTDLTRYPGAVVVHGWMPERATVLKFLEGLDVVFSCETFYHPQFVELARSRKVKTVLAPNFEFLDRRVHPDLLAPPTDWHWRDLPDPKKVLPVPVAVERFPQRGFPATAEHFTHVVGRPAVHDRNGTMDLLKALRHVRADIEVTIRCQDRDFLASIDGYPINRRKVKLNLVGGHVDNYWDNYTGDVLLQPRRFGGLHLPALEALGAGMPVVMPDVSPNEWLPGDWLVPAGWCDSFIAKQRIDIYSANHHALAERIDHFATDAAFFTDARMEANRLAGEHSWDSLRETYIKTFEEL